MASLEAAAGELLAPGSALRHRAVREGAAQSGFSAPMIERALDWTFSEITAGEMRRVLIDDLGSDDAADDPAIRSPGATLLIAAGAIFQPAVNGVVYSLLVKSPIVVKCSSHEKTILPIFTDALRSVDPDVGAAVEAGYFDHSDIAALNADTVVAYGSDETITAIRASAPPCARVVGHGHKVSVAVIRDGALQNEAGALDAAKGLAIDVAMYDQSGCLSPHCAFIAAGAPVAPARFCEMLAGEMQLLAESLPAGRMDVAQAGEIRNFRGDYAFHGAPCFFGDRLAYTIVIDTAPIFHPSPLGRTILVKPVRSLAEVAALLQPQDGRLQGVGAAPVDDLEILEPLLRRLGASYFCPPGLMQRPPLTWRNAGVPCLRSLLVT